MGAITNFNAEEQRNLRQKRTIPRLISVPLAGAGMLAVGLGAGDDNFWVAAALALFTASMMFCWTSALHEAAHQTLWYSQAASVWSGRMLGTLMFTPYTIYREVHIRHHAYLNTPRDWELWPYSDPEASLGFRRAFVWFDLLCSIAAGPVIYGRMYFHPRSPLKDPQLRRTIRYEYLAIAAAWIGIWIYTTLTNQWSAHLRGVILPMYLAATFQTGRKFTEHLGMASFDPLHGTRTVLPSQWLLRLSSFLNFDIFIHGPHHRHPRLTHTTLGDKLKQYRRDNPKAKYPAYDRYWKASMAMLPSMFLNPGCGVNAGGRYVGHTVDGADDFVADVIEQGYAREEQGAIAQQLPKKSQEARAELGTTHAPVG